MKRRPLACVTGGCRRLGAEIAAGLAGAGWDLALHASQACAPEPALAEAIARAGVDAVTLVADFADPARAERLMDEVVTRCGRPPRLLVNSAALFGQDRLETVTARDLAEHYAVNAAAPALLTRAFAAIGGDEEAGARSVINMLDQRIEQPHGDQLSYTLAKLALAGLTRIAARELAPAIRVNAVAPGLTLPSGHYDDGLPGRLAGLMPLNRLPEPGEVAAAVLYLAEARAVTGQVLFVDGGARLESWPRDFFHL